MKDGRRAENEETAENEQNERMTSLEEERATKQTWRAQGEKEKVPTERRGSRTRGRDPETRLQSVC